jgi:hypothetical protein
MQFTTIKGGAAHGADRHPGAMHVRAGNRELSARRRPNVDPQHWESASKKALGDQYAGPRDKTKEQRKLQAEEDYVVLLCRD